MTIDELRAAEARADELRMAEAHATGYLVGAAKIAARWADSDEDMPIELRGTLAALGRALEERRRAVDAHAAAWQAIREGLPVTPGAAS